MAEIRHTFAEKSYMADYLEQIPGFEKGTVQCVCATDAEDALYLGAQMVSDLLSKWFTNVAYFSLLGHAEALQALVQNTAGFTQLYAINQKNPNLGTILQKSQGMLHRKFVRAVIIEGLPDPDQDGLRSLQNFAKEADIPIILLKVS